MKERYDGIVFIDDIAYWVRIYLDKYNPLKSRMYVDGNDKGLKRVSLYHPVWGNTFQEVLNKYGD